MKLPIDTAGVTFLCALAPEPVVDFDTKRQRVDENGVPIVQLQLVCLGDGSADVMTVKVAGEPRGIGQGVPVKVTGLVATPWAMGDRSGIAFRAQRIEPVAAASPSQRSAS
jgi:hypothetical protein